jgi:hypothetical protein
MQIRECGLGSGRVPPRKGHEAIRVALVVCKLVVVNLPVDLMNKLVANQPSEIDTTAATECPVIHPRREAAILAAVREVNERKVQRLLTEGPTTVQRQEPLDLIIFIGA